MQAIDNTKERIVSLDIIRGVALLGILVMNVQSFSMPSSAYINPSSFGDLSGINYLVWVLSNIFADQKFMGIFSMLFGAGVLVFTERAEAKQKSAIKLHYKRNFWLLIFGLIHAHFIWYGDILYSYAMCAFLIFWLRNKTAKSLFIAAFIFLFIGSAYNLFIGVSMELIPDDVKTEILESWMPSVEAHSAEIQAYKGSYFEQFNQRSSEAIFMETSLFFTMFIWRVMGMMCLGMALYKVGFLSNLKDQSFYLKTMSIGFVIGIGLSWIGVFFNVENQFSMEKSMFIGSQFNYWGSVFTAVSYISLVCLWIKSGVMRGLQERMGAIGKMAFSHYIFHSIVFTFIFYGFGLGLFGGVSRFEAFFMVLAMWVFQIFFSKMWLQHFYFGPLEWGWRCLTYGEVSPFRKR